MARALRDVLRRAGVNLTMLANGLAKVEWVLKRGAHDALREAALNSDTIMTGLCAGSTGCMCMAARRPQARLFPSMVRGSHSTLGHKTAQQASSSAIGSDLAAWFDAQRIGRVRWPVLAVAPRPGLGVALVVRSRATRSMGMSALATASFAGSKYWFHVKSP
eukprot:4858822-Pleurochrysis_carterae.AAC.1